MTSRETETHCMGTYSAHKGSFKNPIIVPNELSCSLSSSCVVIMYVINCCMQFVTLQALNQMFTYEKQSHAK